MRPVTQQRAKHQPEPTLSQVDISQTKSRNKKFPRNYKLCTTESHAFHSASDFAVNEMKQKFNKTNEKGALQHTATNRMHACLFASAFSSFFSWIFMVVIPCLLCCFVLASTSTPAHNNEGTGTMHHDSPPADNTRRQRSTVVDGWKQVSALRKKKMVTQIRKWPTTLDSHGSIQIHK